MYIIIVLFIIYKRFVWDEGVVVLVVENRYSYIFKVLDREFHIASILRSRLVFRHHPLSFDYILILISLSIINRYLKALTIQSTGL